MATIKVSNAGCDEKKKKVGVIAAKKKRFGTKKTEPNKKKRAFERKKV